jgi:hypothetical protein
VGARAARDQLSLARVASVPRGQALKNDPVAGATTNMPNAGPVALPESRPGEIYALDLSAVGKTGPLTKFTVRRAGLLPIGGYCFVVR